MELGAGSPLYVQCRAVQLTQPSTAVFAVQAAQMAVPARQKFSAQLLNMRHIERALVSQKEFGKANKVRTTRPGPPGQDRHTECAVHLYNSWRRSTDAPHTIL